MVNHNRGAEPRDSIVCGWTADSSHVLFTSTRSAPLARGGGKLFKVPLDAQAPTSLAGAMPTALPLPEVFHGVLSPSGHAVAYVELPPPTATWKRCAPTRPAPRAASVCSLSEGVCASIIWIIFQIAAARRSR